MKRGRLLLTGSINRLDRDTTGLLILARHMLSACILSEQMAGRRIRREYRAIVLGHTPEEGTVDSPIARAEGSTIERRWTRRQAKGRSPITVPCSTMKKDLSLVSLSLETGRTHQIRVHMRSIGHPLPGDFLYCPDYRYIGRQPLHSYLLRFEHPISGKEMESTAGLPEDMERLLPPGT
ncbi:MAG: RluA family pseudouridine synthase [Enterocloster clostridioformis]